MKPETRYYARQRKALDGCRNKYELKDSPFKEAFWNKTLRNTCIWTNKMHKILVIRLNFLLDALHVSDYISPTSGATL